MTHLNALFKPIGALGSRLEVSLFRWRQLNHYGVAAGVGIILGLLCLVSPLLALAAVFAVAFFLVALVRPIILCYMMIPAIILTSGMERGRIVPMFKPNEAGLVLALGIMAIILLVNKHRRKVNLMYGKTAFLLLIPWLVAAPIIVYLLRGTPLSIRDIFWLVAPLQYFLLFWLFAVVPETKTERQQLLLLMLISATIVALVGLAQAAHIGFVIKLLVNWYPSEHLQALVGDGEGGVGRITSLMGAWNSLGILLMATLLIGWSVFPTIKSNIQRIVVLAAMAISGVCLLASGSFAGIGGAVLGVVIIEMLSQRGLRIVPLVVAGLIGGAVIYLLFQSILEPLIASRLNYQFGGGDSTPQTLSYRFVVWKEVFLPPILEHFPWPVYPTVPDSYTWPVEESQYIMLMFRIGIFGLIGHLSWVVFTLVWLVSRLRQGDDFFRGMVISAIALIIVMSVSGLTNSVFTFSGATDYMWIMLGLIVNSQEEFSV